MRYKSKPGSLRSSTRRTSRPGRPFVLVNMAMTADGKIATANRAVSSFGSARDQEHLLELRATADAVMAGARTVDSSDVNMGPGARRFREQRVRQGLAEFNLRIIVSRTGSVNPNAGIFRQRAEALRELSAKRLPPDHPRVLLARSPIVILTTAAAGLQRRKRLRAVADEVKAFGAAQIDFRQALRWLRRKWNVRRLLCEGGGELNDALFRAGVVDELHLTLCPKIFGGRTAPTISGGLGVQRLARAHQLAVESMRRVQDELFLVFKSVSSKQAH